MSASVLLPFRICQQSCNGILYLVGNGLMGIYKHHFPIRSAPLVIDNGLRLSLEFALYLLSITG